MISWNMRTEGLELKDGSTIKNYHYEFNSTDKVIAKIVEDVFKAIMDISADRKTEPSNSEKPNNCEHITEDGVTCAKYPACDDCLDNPLYKVKGSERLVKGSEQTEPTISKMEQVDKPQADCGNFADRLAYERGVKHAWEVAQKVFTSTVTFYEAEDVAKQIDKDINVRSKTEPQTESLEQFRVGLEYHTDTTHFGKVKGESITTNKVEDEPQTDCAWK